MYKANVQFLCERYNVCILDICGVCMMSALRIRMFVVSSHFFVFTEYVFLLFYVILFSLLLCTSCTTKILNNGHSDAKSRRTTV